LKQKDVEIGGRYWTNVGGTRVEVIVVEARDRWSFGRDARKTGMEFQVKRVDDGRYLPKFRSASALHPAGKGAWPSMTEKQD
jgi:hypothetical protein